MTTHLVNKLIFLALLLTSFAAQSEEISGVVASLGYSGGSWSGGERYDPQYAEISVPKSAGLKVGEKVLLCNTANGKCLSVLQS